MSLGKLPVIKGLVSGSQGKRRFKSELSVDMISPPLGDFRHTMHVGRGGDVFGDTSFLSNYGGVREPGSPDSANSSKMTGFFTRTFRHVRKNSVPRLRVDTRDLSSPPPDISPIIKNAISLPQLNVDSPIAYRQRMLFPCSISSADDSLCTYGLQSGFVTLPRLSRLDRQFQDDVQRGSAPDSGGVTLTRSDSLTSFTVDLGPSLMSEVLDLIDNPTYHHISHQSHTTSDKEERKEEDEEDDSSLTETPVQSPWMLSPNSSMSSGSFSSTAIIRARCSSNCTEQEDERRSLSTPDACTASPMRVAPAMEAERFQRAVDVLSRHYGGGSFTRRMRMSNNTTSPAPSHNHESPYAFSEEEEEEIKV